MSYLRLAINNTTNTEHSVRILHAINIDKINYGMPDGVTIEFLYKVFPYEFVLRNFFISNFPLCFISSPNNRQLNFGRIDIWGFPHPIQPQKNIDGTKREKYKGKEIKLGSDIIFEGDMYDNYFTEKWDSEKWNIADTHEPAIWTPMSYVDVLIKSEQI